MPANSVDCSQEAAAAYGPEYLARWLEFPRCHDCLRPLRPHSSSRATYPATVVKAGLGYCSTHYSARRQKGSLPGDRPSDYPPLARSERQELSDRWSAEQRSVALLVCDHVPDPVSAFEVMSMLGLFDAESYVYAYGLQDPKGIAE